jgi:Protein of unknown function (DUF4232)
VADRGACSLGRAVTQTFFRSEASVSLTKAGHRVARGVPGVETTNRRDSRVGRGEACGGRMTRRRGGCVAVVVLAVSLSACHGGSRSSAIPSTSSTASSNTASATTTSSLLPTTTVGTTTTTTTSTTSETSSGIGLARCGTSNLTVVLGPPNGAAGTIYYEIVFRNDSGSTCEMTGYPGVSFLDASGVQIGVPAQRSGAAYGQVSLAPHANAYAALAVGDPSVRGCPAASAHFVRVFPPNETRPVLIKKVDAPDASGATLGISVCAQQVPPGSLDPVVAHPRF